MTAHTANNGGETENNIMQYRIEGETLPVVICRVQENETLITEKGAMSWMSPNMRMSTNTGGFGKAIGRMFSGESIFKNLYTATGGPGEIAFASSFPGCIKAVEIAPGKEIIAQVLVRVLTRIDSDGVRSIDVFGDLIGLLMVHAGAALVTALGLALVNYMVVVAMAPRLTPLWALPAYQVGAILDLAGGGDASAALALVRPPRARSRHSVDRKSVV